MANTTKEIVYAQLLFKPTKNVFKIPRDEAIEIYRNDTFNYEILGEDLTPPVVEETTVSQQVLEDDTQEQPIENVITDVVVVAKENKAADVVEDDIVTEAQETETALNKLKVADLIATCEARGIKYNSSDKKADLIKKILEDKVENAVE